MAEEARSEAYYDYEDRPRTKIGTNIVTVVIFGVAAAVAAAVAFALRENLLLLVASLVGGIGLAGYMSLSPRVANQWERAIVLRLGRFQAMKGPGLLWIIPFVDRISFWVDLRVRTTTFSAEKTLTSDTVPVDVDAVLFWTVKDPKKATLEVADYHKAVSWAAQTALRDIIGKTELAEMLTGREAIDEDLQKLIDTRTHDWGIVVKSVEIRDVMIPASLEDAMSRQAQAEREKQARIILGDAEVAISDRFAAASKRYVNNPTALQLRAMNILYEGLKEKGSLMVVPSAAVESLTVAGQAAFAALGRTTPEGS